MNERKKGFTLLEMTIVVMIISILFLLTVPSVQKTMNTVDSKACKAMEKVGDAAILEYKLTYDSYPGTVGDLVNAGFLSEEQISCDGSHQMVIIDGEAKVE